MRSWGARVARKVRRRSSRGVVLCYHRVSGPRLDPARLDVPPALFAAHLAVLRAQAQPMPLAEFEAARRAGRLPARAVAVTFDDGYADNLYAALPLLEVNHVPATVFVTTCGVDAPGEFWWDVLARAVYAAHALPESLELNAEGNRFTWRLDEPAGAPLPGARAEDTRRPLYAALSAWLRPLSAAAQREAAAQLKAWSGTDDCAADAHRRLGVHELQTLARSSLIEIGSHSVTHPVLGQRSAAEQQTECADSRAALSQWLGAAPRFFAYPFGEGAAVGRRAESAVRAAGYEAAFTTDARAAWRWNRRTAVPRVEAQAWDGAEFARRLDAWFEA